MSLKDDIDRLVKEGVPRSQAVAIAHKKKKYKKTANEKRRPNKNK